MKKLCLILLLSGWIITNTIAQNYHPVYPLQINQEKGLLEDSKSTPLFLNGDAPWSIIVNLTFEEMIQYLDHRVSKKINAIYVNLIEHQFSNQNPAYQRVDGEDPFNTFLPSTSYLDFTDPNEDYWQVVDSFLILANERGIIVLAFPSYCGWNHGSEGWAAEISANDNSNMYTYGQWLGNRYRDFSNIIWCAGGDWGPTSGSINIMSEFAQLKAGIQSVDTLHLWTAHGGQESGESVYGYLDLDFNTTYRYPPGDVPESIFFDYQLTDTLPTVFFEGHYENEHSVSGLELRFQAYNSVLGGAFGQFFGNRPVWLFDSGWQSALDDPGITYMQYVAKLFQARPIYDMDPDYSHTFLTDGYGNLTGLDYAGSTLETNGKCGMIYVPDNRSIEVDLDQIDGDSVDVYYYNPSDGTSAYSGRIAGNKTQSFTRQIGNADWVLVLDKPEEQYPPLSINVCDNQVYTGHDYVTGSLRQRINCAAWNDTIFIQGILSNDSLWLNSPLRFYKNLRVEGVGVLISTQPLPMITIDAGVEVELFKIDLLDLNIGMHPFFENYGVLQLSDLSLQRMNLPTSPIQFEGVTSFQKNISILFIN